MTISRTSSRSSGNRRYTTSYYGSVTSARKVQMSTLVMLPVAVVVSFLLVVIMQPMVLMDWTGSQRWSADGNPNRVLLESQKGAGSYLMFQACNGFANQRLSIVFGILAGILSNRNLIIPRLPLNGEQRGGGDNIDSNSNNTVKFSEFYNITYINRVLAKRGLHTIEQDFYQTEDVHTAECGNKSFQECLEMYKQIDKTIDIGCGFPANLVTPNIILEHEHTFLDILNALVPVDKYLKEVKKALGQIKRQSDSGGFNLLHLRVEMDWVEHCEVWSNIPDGVVRDNCMNNTATVGDALAGMLYKPNTNLPLMISYNVNVNPGSFDQAMNSVQKHGYKVINNGDLGLKDHQREISAMINYFMALEAKQFVGNSVSSFSAMLIMERRSLGKWASHYNSGDIPMQVFVPLYQTPWILVDDCKDVSQFTKQVLPVLIQGIIVGQLDTYLYCTSEATMDKDILKVIKQNRLNVITHTDIDQFTNGNHNISLYAISKIPKIRQYNYMIITSSNIWLDRQISVNSFRYPLPQFQRDYTFPDEPIARVRLVNTFYVRDQLTNGINTFDPSTQYIEVVDGEQVLSRVEGNLGNLQVGGQAATPILGYDEGKPHNKWGLIKSCRYKEFQQLGYCNRAGNAAA